MLDRFTNRQKSIAALFVILILAIVLHMACDPAHAEEPKGQYFAAVSALYAERFGGGVGVGYQFKSGLLLIGQATYTYSGTREGTVPFAVGCEAFSVPWSTGSVGTPGLAVTVAIPITRR